MTIETNIKNGDKKVIKSTNPFIASGGGSSYDSNLNVFGFLHTSSGHMVGEVKNDDGVYNMKLRYFIFDSYDWKNFKKEEFINILDGLNILFEKFAFPEKQKFIFFYETDVTEMDVVTVIEYRNSPVFIDIEIKNGEKHEELIDNVKNQFLKRKIRQKLS